ncbi:MAG: hypothetical protein ACOZNI_18640 [Myxococcota bacterium]
MWILLLAACQSSAAPAARTAALPPPRPPSAPSPGGMPTMPPTALPPASPMQPSREPPTEETGPPRAAPAVTPEPKDPFDEVEVRLTAAAFAWKATDGDPGALFEDLRARMDVEETPIALDWSISGAWAQAELKGVLAAGGLWARAASRRVGATLLTWRGDGAEGWSLYTEGRLVAARVADAAGTRSVGDPARAAELLGLDAGALDVPGDALARAVGIDPDALVQTHELLQLPARRSAVAHEGALEPGAKVFASPYGVGTIVGENAAEGAWLVQVADIPKVKVPKPSVRPVVSRDEADALLARVGGPAEALRLPWEVRYRAFADRIRGGDPEEIADVLLWLRGAAAERALTDGEVKVADHAARLLADELALATGRPVEEIRASVNPVVGRA